MKHQSTKLGQDRKKVQALAGEIGDLIDKYYPGEMMTGKEVFEVLDALAMMTVFMVTSAPPEKVATFKVYFSQRLGECEAANKELEKEDSEQA